MDSYFLGCCLSTQCWSHAIAYYSLRTDWWYIFRNACLAQADGFFSLGVFLFILFFILLTSVFFSLKGICLFLLALLAPFCSLKIKDIHPKMKICWNPSKISQLWGLVQYNKCLLFKNVICSLNGKFAVKATYMNVCMTCIIKFIQFARILVSVVWKWSLRDADEVNESL